MTPNKIGKAEQELRETVNDVALQLRRFALQDHREGEHTVPEDNATHCPRCRQQVEEAN